MTKYIIVFMSLLIFVFIFTYDQKKTFEKNQENKQFIFRCIKEYNEIEKEVREHW